MAGHVISNHVDKRHTLGHYCVMSELVWDSRKNVKLKVERGVSFEDVAVEMANGRILEVYDHPDQRRHPAQKIAVVELKGYAHLVPFVVRGNEYRLITIIPSRKTTRKHLKGAKEHGKT